MVIPVYHIYVETTIDGSSRKFYAWTVLISQEILAVQSDDRRSFGALGELEQAVMGVLWKHSPACVREVSDQLVDRSLAYTTIMTTLDRLYKKGLLERHKQGHAFFYTPTLDCKTYEQRLVTHVLKNLPTASREALLSGFLDFAGTDEQTLAQLERLIAERKEER